MSAVVLSARVRQRSGKGHARRLRAAGEIPAIMYGVGEPTMLALSLKDTTHLLFGGGTAADGLIELDVEGVGKKGVIMRDHQADVVTGRLLHCDLYEVKKGQKVNVTVSILLVGGTPAGVRAQGVMQHQLHAVDVDCLPNAIPEHLELDASELEIGGALHVSDLVVPEGVTVHANDDVTVVSIVAPKVADEETDVAAEGVEGDDAAEGTDDDAGDDEA